MTWVVLSLTLAFSEQIPILDRVATAPAAARRITSVRARSLRVPTTPPPTPTPSLATARPNRPDRKRDALACDPRGTTERSRASGSPRF
ncbi:hypothetical protein JZ751_018610 [Albula glossodonta]|uniref:Secreted protein n=1 Tax=Albula glossodonta TaxID=121402 RepID=A0A8T2MU99_9TELE|nr:hypothetical protein JZ751_018610 [Albula glossodonta]